ncbi:hypothetical protein [Amniculibacterium sp. G2-70]|uniref:hypothetical protein n=1 Tax=Amniculibacterium sp. G2-70 TaxID=2767188 RepID=UPI001654A510|nr:hypothetical protein [Amniculibacterium sp. G2-70]
MKKISVVILCGWMVLSCKKEEKLSSENQNDSIAVVQDSVRTTGEEMVHFETFSFPENIQGCSCSFAKDKTAFEKGELLFADDYGNEATIKVGGDFLKFPMEEGDFDPSNFNRILKHNGYTLEMKTKKLNSDPEAMIFEGSMTLTTPQGKSIHSTIYGECGC